MKVKTLSCLFSVGTVIISLALFLLSSAFSGCAAVSPGTIDKICATEASIHAVVEQLCAMKKLLPASPASGKVAQGIQGGGSSTLDTPAVTSMSEPDSIRELVLKKYVSVLSDSLKNLAQNPPDGVIDSQELELRRIIAVLSDSLAKETQP
jgi:hypothetical protein